MPSVKRGLATQTLVDTADVDELWRSLASALSEREAVAGWVCVTDAVVHGWAGERLDGRPLHGELALEGGGALSVSLEGDRWVLRAFSPSAEGELTRVERELVSSRPAQRGQAWFARYAVYWRAVVRDGLPELRPYASHLLGMVERARDGGDVP